MQRVEHDVFPLPIAGVADNDLADVADDHLVDITSHPNFPVAIGDREVMSHRVV